MDKQLKNLILIYSVGVIPVIILVILRKIYKIEFKKLQENHAFIKKLFWKFTNLVMYFILGYFAPKYWYISTIIGISWENLESYLHNFHNIPIYADLNDDFVANSLGLLCGIVTRFR